MSLAICKRELYILWSPFCIVVGPDQKGVGLMLKKGGSLGMLLSTLTQGGEKRKTTLRCLGLVLPKAWGEKKALAQVKRGAKSKYIYSTYTTYIICTYYIEIL